MTTTGDKVDIDRIGTVIAEWIGVYQQLSFGEPTWRHRSFGDLLAAHGELFLPAPWPDSDSHPQRAGQCFAAANEYADRHGWIYVEGLVCLPDMHVIDHAWCLTPSATVADPALPDGTARGYFGIPITPEFRHAQRARGTDAVFTADPAHPLAGHVNEEIMCLGLPADAVTTLPNT